MAAHKSVRGEKIRDLDVMLCTDREDLVGSVSHAVHHYFFVCFLEMSPEIALRHDKIPFTY